jgi:hypothetical protein
LHYQGFFDTVSTRCKAAAKSCQLNPTFETSWTIHLA